MMTNTPTQPVDPRIIGTGYAVPPSVRLNDDPIFRWAWESDKKDQLFEGYNERRFLAPGESLVDLMAAACRMAMSEADVQPSDIDIVIGDASMGEFILPNALTAVHGALGLPKTTWPIAVTSGFSQFNAAMLLADALIRAGRARNILIALGDSWTQLVRPQDPQALSAADGAAACVVGQKKDASNWGLVASRTQAAPEYYGSMYMAPDPVAADGDATAFTAPYFHITAKGVEGFTSFGMHEPPLIAVSQLNDQPQLEKRKGHWKDVCLITHQASSKLMSYWQQEIAPEHVVNTIGQFANMVHCSTLFNIAWGARNDPGFKQGWLQTLCLGPDMHVNVSLYRRNF